MKETIALGYDDAPEGTDKGQNQVCAGSLIRRYWCHIYHTETQGSMWTRDEGAPKWKSVHHVIRSLVKSERNYNKVEEESLAI